MTMKQAIVTSLSAAGLVLAGGLSWAAGQYGPGASDTEIKIGNTVPYSGPASTYGIIGKSEAAYFAMINDQGGINGRKVMAQKSCREHCCQNHNRDHLLHQVIPLGTQTRGPQTQTYSSPIFAALSATNTSATSPAATILTSAKLSITISPLFQSSPPTVSGA
jgi:hypothetical protein